MKFVPFEKENMFIPDGQKIIATGFSSIEYIFSDEGFF